jgi:hypothetical protein
MERAAASGWPYPQAYGDQHRDVTQIGAVPHGGFDADFQGNPSYRERLDPAIA